MLRYAGTRPVVTLFSSQRHANSGNWDTVSPETTSSGGTMTKKGYPESGSCQYSNNLPVEGATSRNTSLDDKGLGFYESALFSLLSVLLAQADPSNGTYARAATLSLDFALREAAANDYSSRLPSLPFETLVGQGCKPLFFLHGIGTTGLGTTIEAMSIMHSIISGSEYNLPKIQDVITSTLNGLDLDASGVLTNFQTTVLSAGLNQTLDAGDINLVRGLAEAYRRSKGGFSAGIRDNVKTFLGVHYNAIRDLATSGDSVYGREWRGPRPAQVTFDLYNQAAAAQILVDGISIFNGSDNMPPSPSPSATVASPKPSAALIAGVTVGTIVGASLVMYGAFYVVRRRRSRYGAAPSSESNDTVPVIEPFIATTFEKTTAFPNKYPVPETQARTEVVREPHLEPLRQRNPSSPEAIDVSRSHQNISGSSTSEAASTDNTRERDQAEVRSMEMDPTFPDMVRAVYQRLWQSNGSENPPDYPSEAGEPTRRV
ncbi:hypothetical protein PM082_014452 [Marasmius tenuissimus]|nr:hypothetical protein PM082_014452 [Marasmius tenuissimus]